MILKKKWDSMIIQGFSIKIVFYENSIIYAYIHEPCCMLVIALISQTTLNIIVPRLLGSLQSAAWKIDGRWTFMW